MSKCYWTLVLLWGMVPEAIGSQPCGATDITLESQAQINSFQSTFGPCDTVEGELVIGGVGAQTNDITSLAPLSGLVAVGGLLRIGYVGLTDFGALSGIDTLGGLFLWENRNLENLEVFANIEHVSGPIEVADSPNLQSIDGLRNLRFIGYSLTLANLPLVSTLQPLQNLESVGSNIDTGGLYLYGLGITNLLGLQNLLVLEGGVGITLNGQLVSLDGFPQAVTSVDTLSIAFNEQLSNISALGNLTKIDGPDPEGYFRLSHTNLERLDGLENLEQVNSYLAIIFNSNLTHCTALQKLLDDVDDGDAGPGTHPFPDVGGQISFTANGLTCDSIQGALGLIHRDGFELTF